MAVLPHSNVDQNVCQFCMLYSMFCFLSGLFFLRDELNTLDKNRTQGKGAATVSRIELFTFARVREKVEPYAFQFRKEGRFCCLCASNFSQKKMRAGVNKIVWHVVSIYVRVCLLTLLNSMQIA